MLTKSPDWTEVRAQFPALQRFTYLDTASFGQMPLLARDAMVKHLDHRDETACKQFLSWFDDMDMIRADCARLIHCDATEIAFVVNASTALSFLMQGLPWHAGDEVLTLSGEFPNQLYQSASLESHGAKLRTVAWPEFYQSITQHTRLVLLSTVNYATGFVVPMEEVSRFLRARDILLYVDGTQSLGAIEFDVTKIRPSMLAVDAYKWMMSPNGAGFAYVDPELTRRLRPTVVGWRSDQGWRQVNSLNHGVPVWSHQAEKFEGGMLAFPCLYAMGAVIEWLLDIGPEAVETYVLQLSSHTRALLTKLGAEVNQDASPIITARFAGHNAVHQVDVLREKGILISARHGRLRISTHLYNNETDAQVLLDALSKT